MLDPDEVRGFYGDNTQAFMRYVRRWARLKQFPTPEEFAEAWNPYQIELWPGMPSEMITGFVNEAFERRHVWDALREYLADQHRGDIPVEFLPFVQAVMRDDKPPKAPTKGNRISTKDRNESIVRLKSILVEDYGLKDGHNPLSGAKSASMVVANALGLEPESVRKIR